jgi:acyl CoA:acetate/3-ketoacid CoA transferase beta subunit
LPIGKSLENGQRNGRRNGFGSFGRKYHCGNDAREQSRRIENSKKCTLPLTGVNCVKKVVTELAVMEITDKGFKLERAPGISVEDIVKATEAI